MIQGVSYVTGKLKTLFKQEIFIDGRSSHPNLQDGGALQISIKRFQVDFYPYHLAKGTGCNVIKQLWEGCF